MDFAQLFISAFGLVRPEVVAASLALNNLYSGIAIGIALILALSFCFQEQRKLPYLAFALVIALLLGYGFKAFLQVERPCTETPGKIPCPLDFSLPSIHALIAFTLAIVAVGNRSFPFYLLFALFVAFSRVYLGVHTIPQVMAGLALAFFACVLAEIIWRREGWELPTGVCLAHDARGLKN